MIFKREGGEENSIENFVIHHTPLYLIEMTFISVAAVNSFIQRNIAETYFILNKATGISRDVNLKSTESV